MSKLSVVITKEEDWYVSWCPELDIASQGKNVEEAISNLKEAIELYLEDEDAILTDKTPIITTIEVSHAKASDSVSS